MLLLNLVALLWSLCLFRQGDLFWAFRPWVFHYSLRSFMATGRLVIVKERKGAVRRMMDDAFR
ncbi:hypothetical protein THS27_21570 [Thalassospira sp. MCCC 1A01428]|nr:hypothetical protein THS27_21570 [Thalassospira sp. MCCC 1A01428]